MSRYVKLKPVTWVRMEKPLMGVFTRPQYGDCVGVYEVTEEGILNEALRDAWEHHFCFEIEKVEFETLLAFGIPLLDPKKKPPCTKPG